MSEGVIKCSLKMEIIIFVLDAISVRFAFSFKEPKTSQTISKQSINELIN